MPSKSKKQQRFMGMVRAYQKGELKGASPSIKKAARSMDPEDVKHFAETKHKGLSERVKKKKNENINVIKFDSFLFEKEYEEYAKQIKNGFNDLTAEIEKLEITIRKYQGRPGKPHDDLDMKYRVLADNLQSMIREFIQQYSIFKKTMV